MTADQDEIARREKIALDAIKRSLGTDAGEFGATLFASHHLAEIDESYWQEHLRTAKPNPAQVLGILCLRSHWGEDDDDGIDMDGIDTFDFCLPGDVSNYVLSVRFDEEGEVEDISMES
jgi:hypothetical protein